MESTDPKEWCTIERIGRSCSGVMTDEGINGTNTTHNFTCTHPFCVIVLKYTFKESYVRVYDLCLLVFVALFLGYLLVRLVPTVRKLHGSLPLFRILYCMVFVIPVVSCIHEVLAMVSGYQSLPAKVSHVILRGTILMTELSVVIFGLSFKYYNNKQYKLVLTTAIIVVVAIIFTIAEGVLEFLPQRDNLACNDFGFFTHGGMLFLFASSTLFAIAYFLTFLLYLFGLHKRWNMPSKKSFYRYALFLSLVNVVQAIGSMLWYNGKDHRRSGHAGICLTTTTTVIYTTTFAPMVYWIFLSNYFRMNKTSLNESETSVTTEDPTLQQKRISLRFSKPIPTGRRSAYIEEQTQLMAESYSSTSSYGSVPYDGEIFARRET